MRVIKICCRQYGTLLYHYRKAKPGHLVKCYENMIIKDFARGDLKCSQCGQMFARKKIIHNQPAHKIIQGKIYTKG